MKFEIISEITAVETIAQGNSIRILPMLNKKYGKGRWRKKKGVATVKLLDGSRMELGHSCPNERESAKNAFEENQIDWLMKFFRLLRFTTQSCGQ
jgi:hypothetical protein